MSEEKVGTVWKVVRDTEDGLRSWIYESLPSDWVCDYAPDVWTEPREGRLFAYSDEEKAVTEAKLTGRNSRVFEARGMDVQPAFWAAWFFRDPEALLAFWARRACDEMPLMPLGTGVVTCTKIMLVEEIEIWPPE